MEDHPMTAPQPNQVNIELAPDLAPIYTNLVRISHSPAELVFDFSSLLPNERTAKVLARLIMSPMGAKMLHRALGENLSRYEASFGEIPIPRETGLAGDLFKTIHPPDPPQGETS
jgi:hypothetical protein